jgi:hypothetical protein
MIHVHDAASRLNLSELASDVSRTARSFFARFGFQIVEQRTAVIDGVTIPNARVRKQIRWSRE